MDGANITERCSGHTGSGQNAYLTGTQCTITSVDPSWPGTTRTIEIRAYNLCGETSTTRSFQWAPNLPPFCDAFTFNPGAGRILGGRYANYGQNQFSIDVTAGETDPYGNPRHLRFCYKIATDPDPGAQWVCPYIASGQNSGVFTSSIDQMKAQFVGNPYYNDIDTQGFWTTTNVYDNVTQNFCNGWDMYQPVGGTCDGGDCLLRFQNQAPSITATTPDHDDNPIVGTATDNDNGPACVDNNPTNYSMTVNDPDGSADIDRMEFSLATPAMLGGDNQKYLPLSIIFSKKLTLPGYQAFAANTFFIRDSRVDGSGTQRCIRSNQTDFPLTTANSGWSPNFTDPNNVANTLTARTSSDRNVWCYAEDSHSWSDGVATTATVGGVQYNVWYLQGDLTIHGNGYSATLKGATGGNWNTGTYVLYQQNGNNAIANFQVQFNGEGTGSWSGTYHNLWLTKDEMGKMDDTANLPGESIVNYTSGHVMHNRGTTTIDLVRPTVTLDTASIVNAEVIAVPWSAQDQHTGATGLDNYYMEGLLQDGGPTIAPIASNNNFPGQPVAWYNPWPADNPNNPDGDYNDDRPESQYLRELDITGAPQTQNETEWINIGDNDSGSLVFDGYAVDRACNMNNNPSSTIFEDIFRPWMVTRAGLVYTDEITDTVTVREYDPDHPNLCLSVPGCTTFTTYPFNFATDTIDITTEWIGAGSSTIPQAIFKNSANNFLFRSPNYADNNNRSWYEDLLESAQKTIQSSPADVNVGTFAGGAMPTYASGVTGCTTTNGNPCIVISNAAAVIGGAQPFTCNVPAVFFLPSLTIDQDIVNDNNRNGCIFVVSGNVTINDGLYRSSGSAYPKYDTLNTFIIADGKIDIPEVDLGQPIRDGLKVRGSLLAFGTSENGKSIEMDRTLRLANNATYPTYVLHHDTRYYEIARAVFSNDREAIKQEVGFKP
ncbi:MAG: hypothetical protein QY318_03235 [Candidatus Dojkabacteria bacterium]|nr:MAG: hypothetical protein QY318_03235 [Candidatus Dojkabacteria bacterium]